MAWSPPVWKVPYVGVGVGVVLGGVCAEAGETDGGLYAGEAGRGEHLMTGGGGDGVAGVLIFFGRGAAALVLSVVLPAGVAVLSAVLAVLEVLLLLLVLVMVLFVAEEEEEEEFVFCCWACCRHFARLFLNQTWTRLSGRLILIATSSRIKISG